jgi:hypothetical protein
MELLTMIQDTYKKRNTVFHRGTAALAVSITICKTLEKG